MRRPTRDKTVLACLVSILALLLAACGSAGPARPGASAGPMIWAVQSGAANAVYQDSVQRYNKAHGGTPIQLQMFENDPYKQKLRVAMGAGNPPDMFFGWGGGVLDSYINAGDVADLTPDLQQDPAWQNKFFPNVMRSVTFNGKVYGIPMRGMQPVVLFYNKDVLAKAGVQPPKTWQDLLTAIARLRATGVIPISLAGASTWTYLMWEEYLVDRFGTPQAFQQVIAGKPDSWSQPAFLRANTAIQQLVNAGAFGNGFSSVSYDTGQQSALLYTGKAGMELMGSWDFASMLQSDPAFIKSGKLGWITFPTIPGTPGDPNDVVGNTSNFYSVSQKSPHRNEDIDYLKNTVLDDQYVNQLINVGDVPPVQGIQPKLANADNSAYLEFIYQITQNAPNFQLSWDQALPPDQAQAVLTNLEQLFLGKINPQQFSTAMNGTLK